MNTPQLPECSVCGKTLRAGYGASICPSCACAATETPHFQRGIAGYEIIQTLGRGGMGEVFLAYHSTTVRTVALKVPVSSATAEILQRFQLEVESVAALDHPGILPIYEVGMADGLPFYTMKLAEGGSLAERVSEFAGHPRLAAELVRQIAEALQHAHSRGILHRDLKPQNILLSSDRKAWVSDFGLARWVNRDSDLTRVETLVGSPNYLAPELLAGSKNAPTVAADIFSLGAILYLLLQGHPPFEGDSLAGTLANIARCPRPPLVGVDRDMEAICLRALEKRPEDRFRSAGDFAADLGRWLEGLPVSSRQIGPPALVWRWAKRHPGRAAAAIFLCVSVFATSAGLFGLHERAVRAEADREAVAAFLQRDKDWNRYRAESVRLRLAGGPDQRRASLQAIQKAWKIRPDTTLRNDALLSLSLPGVKESTSEILEPECTTLTFSEGGTAYTFVSREGLFWRTLGKTEARKISHEAGDANAIALGFSPSATVAGFWFETGKLLLVASGKPEQVCETQADSPKLCTFLGENLLSVEGNFLRIVGDGEERWLPVQGRVTEVRGSRSGTKIAYITPKEAGGAYEISLVKADGGTLLRRLVSPNAVTALEWSPDEAHLVVATNDKQVWAWPVDPALPPRRILAHESDCLSLRFRPKGGELLISTGDGMVWVINYSSGQATLWCTSQADPSVAPVWGKGDANVYFLSSDRRSVWKLELEMPLVRELPPPDGGEVAHEAARTIDLSADEGFAVVASERANRVWDLHTERVVATIPKVLEEWAIGRFFPEGRLAISGWNSGCRFFELSDLGQGKVAPSPALPSTIGTVLFGQVNNQLVLLDRERNRFLLRSAAGEKALAQPNPFCVAVSKEGKWAVTGSFDQPNVALWRTEQSEMVATFPSHAAPRVAFCGEEGVVVAERSKLVRYQLTTGKVEWEVVCDSPIRSVECDSSRGELGVETVSDLRLLNPANGEELLRFPPLGGQLTHSFDFSSSGRLLVLQTARAGIVVWDLKAVRFHLNALGMGW